MISSCPTNNLASELVENGIFLKPIFITKLKIGLPSVSFQLLCRFVSLFRYPDSVRESVANTLHRKSTFDTDIPQLYKQQVKKHIPFLYNEKEDKNKSFCLFIEESILFLFIYSLIINLLQVMTIISYHFFCFHFIFFIIFHFILSYISWWQL